MPGLTSCGLRDGLAIRHDIPRALSANHQLVSARDVLDSARMSAGDGANHLPLEQW